MDEAQAVIIGGGVGGTSIAYHLTELGWRDIVLVDRAELTSGSTFHSAGLVGQLGEVLNEYDDPNDSWLHRLVLPVLAGYSGRHLAKLLGTDRRTIDRIRGGQKPRPGLRDAAPSCRATGDRRPVREWDPAPGRGAADDTSNDPDLLGHAQWHGAEHLR